MSIKLAVFDMAGTTVVDRNAVAIAFCKAFETEKINITEEEVRPLMGYKKPVAISIVLEKQGIEEDEMLVDSIHAAFVDEMLSYYASSADVAALPHAEQVFLQLKERGIRIALNTGFSRDITDVIIDRLQWKQKGLIDDSIASDEVEKGRPYPFMIQTLMQRAGITDAGEVIKIGDTEVDINEGRNAGCGIVVGVTTGAFTREQLEEYRPDHIIDSLAELPILLSSHE